VEKPQARSGWRRLAHGEWCLRLGEAGVAGPLAGDIASYLGLLAQWEGAVDLVGRVDAGELLRGHVLESLAGAAFLGAAGRLLDIGSGNGFPAVPLLLARRDLTGVLLEPRERRWAFLREVVRELGLAAEVRRERLGEHVGSGYSHLTVRALGASEWRDRAPGLLAGSGTLLWWTTRGAAAGLQLAGLERVLTSPLPAPERGVIAVWRRCST
jgi:16S rRNA (guanine527-N7)-methyltransferase